MRDRELILRILKSVGNTGSPYLEGVDRKALNDNLCLAVDGGLVSGISYMQAVDNGELSWSMSSPGLTNAGHDFLKC